MIRLRRRNTAWLVALGMLITFALLAAPIPVAIQAVLLSIFAVAMVASTVEIGRERESIIQAIRRAPLRQRVSPQAREAMERAKSYGGYINDRLMLLDTGLIASQSSYEGMAMRRTRSVSKDDDGVRPFVTLYIDPEEAGRNAVIRFEIFNQYGDQQYIHEMKTYLRDGEMNIMADHHLKLSGNRDIQGSGDWDLRVYIDGNLAAMQHFMLAPSVAERTRRLTGNEVDDGEADYYEIIDEEEQQIPTSLQDLLNKENSARQANSSSTSDRSSSRRRTTGTVTRRRR